MMLDEDDMDDLADELSNLRALDAVRTRRTTGGIPAPLAGTSHSQQRVQVNSTPNSRERSGGAALGADIAKVRDGLFYNRRFGANNVWEIEVDSALVDEATRIYYTHLHQRSAAQARGGPCGSEAEMGSLVHHEPISTPDGGFLVKRIRDWGSDISWISVDDPTSFRLFESLWHRMGVREKFGAVVPHVEDLRLFSAYYVTRTWCESHKWHFDYNAPCGTDALTMMTPLAEFGEKSCFQLSYHGSNADGSSNREELDDVRRYEYTKGRAVVFGSQFYHSTEVGKSLDGEVHTYLCFTFGTDNQDSWPEIAKILGQASRIVQHPNGQLHLTNLGRDQQHSLEPPKAPRSDNKDDQALKGSKEAHQDQGAGDQSLKTKGGSLQQQLSGMSDYLRTKHNSMSRLRAKLSCN